MKLLHDGRMTRAGEAVLPIEWKINKLNKDPGYIEIPGGHVEKDETLEDALRREMKEELGIRVERAKLVHRGLYTATNGERGRIHYFHVERWKGKIVSMEAERVYWESEVSNLSIIPDRKAVRRVLRVEPLRSK